MIDGTVRQGAVGYAGGGLGGGAAAPSAAMDDDDDRFTQITIGSIGSVVSVDEAMGGGGGGVDLFAAASAAEAAVAGPLPPPKAKRTQAVRRPKVARHWKLITLRVRPKLTATGGIEDDEDEEADAEALSGGAGGGAAMVDDGALSQLSFASADTSATMPVGAAAATARAAASSSSGYIVITLPWLPVWDPLIEDGYLISRHAYLRCLARNLRPGTQMRAMFLVRPSPLAACCPTCHHHCLCHPSHPLTTLPSSWTLAPSTLLQRQDGNPWDGEWHEGRVFSFETRRVDRERGWDKCRYKSVRVLWYRQDALTAAWYIEIMQTANHQSPWVSC